jgi:hypothetical protein
LRKLKKKQLKRKEVVCVEETEKKRKRQRKEKVEKVMERRIITCTHNMWCAQILFVRDATLMSLPNVVTVPVAVKLRKYFC